MGEVGEEGVSKLGRSLELLVDYDGVNLFGAVDGYVGIKA